MSTSHTVGAGLLAAGLLGCPVKGGAAGVTASADSDYLVRAWETAEGLPENSTTAIGQTKDGYLWFGTFNGLVRFNGVEFRVFNPANTPQLPSEAIVNLYIDKADRFFVSTYRGLVLREGLQWREIYRGDAAQGDFARTFSERTSGDLFITTFNGKVFEFSGGKLTELPTPPGEKGQGFLGAVDEEGHWWVVQNKFIGRWDDGRWVQTLVPPTLPNDAVSCAPSRDGGIWLLLGTELRKLRRGIETAKISLPESPGGVWSFSEDSQGNIWIATYRQGFCRVAPNGTMVRWTGAEGWSDSGRCVFEDRESNLWVGTSGDGLLRLTPRRFHHLPLVGGRKGVVVHSIAADAKGRVWAATYGLGLFQIGGNGLMNSAPVHLPGDMPYLQSVIADRTGRTWVGTYNRGLQLISGGETQSVSLPQSVGPNPIALFEDSGTGVWISGAQAAVCRLAGTNVQVFGAAEGLLQGGVTAFAEDKVGAIWAASDKAVLRRQREQLFAEVRDPAGKPIAGITCFKPDKDGCVWLGSRDRGLLRWKDGRLDVVDRSEGFPFEAIYSIIDDGTGFFWMTSVQSIARAPLTELHEVADGELWRLSCQVFDASDGLPKAELTTGRQPALARDTQGRLWFAMKKGVAMIDPSALRLNEKPPPVHIERLSFYRPAFLETNTTSSRQHLREAQSHLAAPFPGEVRLPAGTHRIEIHYAGLSFAAPEKVRFQIALEGQASGWTDVDAGRVAYFQELPPRPYVFRVRAANNDGLWNETGATLAFSIAPFYWQTVWFRLLMGLLLVSAGAAATWWWARIHVRRAGERERVANQIRELAGRLIRAQEEERTRLARELHDDITQRLACLAIDVGRFEDGTAELTPTETASQVQSGLIQLSEDVHALSYRLHPSILEDLGLAEALEAEIEGFERQQSIPVKANLSEIPPAMPHESALCLFRVVQEALRNISRHAHARSVQISLRPSDGGVQLAVQDDGCGFDPAASRERPSLGLSSMKERVLSLGGELDIESACGRGTTIVAWVPLRGLNAKG